MIGRVLSFFLFVLVLAGYAQVEGAATTSTPLKKVDPKKVCTVMDRVFSQDLTPVEVKGHTYYSLCGMCSDQLKQDAAARTAVDPVTGKKVDKATALPAADRDGAVYYFESSKTLEQYQSGKRAPAKK
jgi:YHS domain-containing protein